MEEPVKKRRGRPPKKKVEPIKEDISLEELEAFIEQEEAAAIEEEGALEDITIDYVPRTLWRTELHRIMDEYRFVVLVAHRRFGKTVGLVNHIIKMAIENTKTSPRYAYIAPWKTQAKSVAWEYFKQYTKDIPGVKVNAQDLYVELPTKHKGMAGARIYILGADNPDIMRGLYFDGVILDEYAQMDTSVYGKIIRPALADRRGKCFFIGTPEGENAFYEVYQQALKEMAKPSNEKKKEWQARLYSIDDTVNFPDAPIPKAEVESMKEEMTDIEFRQEMLCDFTVSAYDVVIPLDVISNSANKLLTEKDVLKDEPVIMGIDIARFGDDRTTIWKRSGLFVDKPKVYKGLDTMQVVDMIIIAMREWKPDAVFIDGGNMGAGVIDRLKQLGYMNVYEIPFGSSAMDKDRYENIRAEMYFKAKEWMVNGGAIPNMQGLKKELSATRYKFSKRGRIILEAKEAIKARTNESPDLADGFVLTFAKPVAMKRRNLLGAKKPMCNCEYSIMSLFD